MLYMRHNVIAALKLHTKPSLTLVVQCAFSKRMCLVQACISIAAKSRTNTFTMSASLCFCSRLSCCTVRAGQLLFLLSLAPCRAFMSHEHPEYIIHTIEVWCSSCALCLPVKVQLICTSGAGLCVYSTTFIATSAACVKNLQYIWRCCR